MAKDYVSYSRESSRMLKSNLLEPLSRVYYAVPLFIFVPVIGYFVLKALIQGPIGLLSFSAFYWSFKGCVTHRFVFHFTPRGKLMEHIHFISHGVHHDYPNDAKRLVMPPSVCIPLATGFYFLFSIFFRELTLLHFFQDLSQLIFMT